MLRILHAADLHLGAPCLGLSPEKAALRRRELLAIPERLRTLAEERQVDLMLLPGDLFDRPSGLAGEAELLARTLGRLKIPVFLAPGNHDYYSAASPYASVQWPRNVFLFTQSQLKTVRLPRLNCTVTGGAFTAPYQERSLLEGFRPRPREELSLLCVHGEVANGGRYNPLPPPLLERSGFRYVALGHNHSFGGVKQFGSTFCAWPGCPEGHGFDETGDKGALYIEIDETAVTSEFIPLCQREYRDVTLDTSGMDTVQDLWKALRPSSPSPHLLRVTLQGDRPPDWNLDKLSEQLSQEYFSFSWVDNTLPRQELWARLEEDSLTGVFLRLVKARLDSAPPEERRLLQQAACIGLAALEGRSEVGL